jgi:hypothetical protein
MVLFGVQVVTEDRPCPVVKLPSSILRSTISATEQGRFSKTITFLTLGLNPEEETDDKEVLIIDTLP